MDSHGFLHHSIPGRQELLLPAYKIKFWASEFAFLPKSKLNTNTDNVLCDFYTTFCKLLNKPWISRLLCSSGERIFFLTTVNPEAGLRVQCVVGYVGDSKKKKATEEQSTNRYTWDKFLNLLPTRYRQLRTLSDPNSKVSVES